MQRVFEVTHYNLFPVFVDGVSAKTESSQIVFLHCHHQRVLCSQCETLACEGCYGVGGLTGALPLAAAQE